MSGNIGLAEKALEHLKCLEEIILAQQDIILGQASAYQRMTERILEYDSMVGELQLRVDQLNKENFWLSEGRKAE